MTELHPRQQSILEFLKTSRRAPSVREIGAAIGLRSSSTVQAHLDILEKRGLVRRDPLKSRSVEVVDIAPRACPHCGEKLP